uniref:Galanin peptides n=1 Tax=Zosterops lateralis melanops TaxID=1220523 RepID=A0A8D2PUM5_ZOSLA
VRTASQFMCRYILTFFFRTSESSNSFNAVDNHRSFNDKHGFTGKREIPPEEDIKAGNLGRPMADENIMRTVIEFLTYLHLKGKGYPLMYTSAADLSVQDLERHLWDHSHTQSDPENLQLSGDLM